MNAAELLSLATARPPNWENAPGGIPILTQQDVMYALACIHHNGASLLLRVKYADQKTYIGDLEKEVLKATKELWEEKNWGFPEGKGSEYLGEMTRFAITEQIIPHICLRCGGWGEDIEHGKRIPCDNCRGSGRKNPSERARAQILGVEREQWRYTWSDRYGYIRAFMEAWEGMGIGRATAKLRG